jgi:outer membrane receptor protein involved in Fe transport
MTDLNLTYNFANRPVSLTAYVQNLENTPVYNYAVQGAFITNFAATDIGPPQTYGVRLNYAF